jgi:hypothetical protein
MDEWNSINKCIPFFSNEVLVLSEGKEIHAFWDRTRFWDRTSSDLGDWYDVKNNCIIQNVTHWMYIPEKKT